MANAPGTMDLSMKHDDQSDLQRRVRLERLATWLDSRFRVPGTGLRFGLDGLIGLIPGIGDLFMAGMSVYLIAEARQMKVRKRIIARMLWNALVDAGLGSVPIVGDLFDFVHKANLKNVRLLVAELDSNAARRG